MCHKDCFYFLIVLLSLLVGPLNLVFGYFGAQTHIKCLGFFSELNFSCMPRKFLLLFFFNIPVPYLICLQLLIIEIQSLELNDIGRKSEASWACILK